MSPERKIGPVSPEQVGELKKEQIPEVVFEVFNELIAQNLRDNIAKVLKTDVEAKLEARGISLNEAYDRHWFDVESSYIEAGWRVQYDQPIYWGGENFEAYYEFRAGK